MIFDPEGKATLNDSKSTAEISCAMSGTRDPCSYTMQQTQTANNAGPITVREVYDITERYYHWESFKYVVPKAYHQDECKDMPQDKPEHKKNYIDDVLKIKKNILSPNYYEIKENYRPLSGKMCNS